MSWPKWRLQLPGWLLVGGGVLSWLIKALDWWSRIEFAVQKVQWLHSMMPQIESVVGSIWFSPALLLVGLTLLYTARRQPRRELSTPRPEPAPSPVPSQRPPSPLPSPVQGVHQPKALIKYGGRSLDMTIALKANAADIRSLLESIGWQAFIASQALSGVARKNLAGVEVHGANPSLVDPAVELLASRGYPVQAVFGSVTPASGTQYDIEVWIGESPA